MSEFCIPTLRFGDHSRVGSPTPLSLSLFQLWITLIRLQFTGAPNMRLSFPGLFRGPERNRGRGMVPKFELGSLASACGNGSFWRMGPSHEETEAERSAARRRRQEQKCGRGISEGIPELIPSPPSGSACLVRPLEDSYWLPLDNWGRPTRRRPGRSRIRENQSEGDAVGHVAVQEITAVLLRQLAEFLQETRGFSALIFERENRKKNGCPVLRGTCDNFSSLYTIRSSTYDQARRRPPDEAAVFC